MPELGSKKKKEKEKKGSSLFAWRRRYLGSLVFPRAASPALFRCSFAVAAFPFPLVFL